MSLFERDKVGSDFYQTQTLRLGTSVAQRTLLVQWEVNRPAGSEDFDVVSLSVNLAQSFPTLDGVLRGTHVS